MLPLTLWLASLVAALSGRPGDPPLDPFLRQLVIGLHVRSSAARCFWASCEHVKTNAQLYRQTCTPHSICCHCRSLKLVCDLSHSLLVVLPLICEIETLLRAALLAHVHLSSGSCAGR